MNFELNFQFSIFSFQFKRRHRDDVSTKYSVTKTYLIYNKILTRCLSVLVTWCLSFGRSGYRRRAFRSIFARFCFLLAQKYLQIPKSPFPNPNSQLRSQRMPLQSLTHWGLLKINFPFSTFNFQFHKALPYAIYVSPFQGYG